MASEQQPTESIRMAETERAAGERLIRLRDVIAMVGVSRAKVYAMVRAGEFPRPRKLRHASVWYEPEIREWIASVAGQPRLEGVAAVEPVSAELRIAMLAVRLYAETHPRPSHITQVQAAEMLGVTPRTVHTLVRAGKLRPNKLGRVPIEQVDRLLQPAWGEE